MTGYVLVESDLDAIEKTTPGDPKIHCILAKGEGLREFYSYGSLAYLGIWTQDLLEVKYGFKDDDGILATHAEAEWLKRQQDYQWNVKFHQKKGLEYLIRPGDFATIRPMYEPEEYLSASNIAMHGDGTVDIEFGAARIKFLDCWKVWEGLPGGFSDRYMRTSHEPITQTGNFYPTDPAHVAAEGELTFAVPSGVLDDNLNPRITITLDLNPSTDTSLSFGRVAVRLRIGDDYPNNCQFIATTIGDAAESSSDEMDVTDYITAGTDNKIYLEVVAVDEFTDTHADYTGHPEISASVTMNFWKRGSLV